MYQQFNYGTRMTRMVRIFADLYMKTRLNLRHQRAIFKVFSITSCRSESINFIIIRTRMTRMVRIFAGFFYVESV